MDTHLSHGLPNLLQSGLPDLPQRDIPHILIVDDSADIGWTTARLLQIRGYRTSFATSAEEAAQKLRSSNVSLVIIDGDLGDKNYGNGGMAARLIEEHVRGSTRFVRCSGRPDAIPNELHGEKCFLKNGDINEIVAWLNENLKTA